MLSIVIRVRNEAKALQKTLINLSNQKTDLDFEIIIVDSNSTDNTVDVAKSYGCKIVNIDQSTFSWGKALNCGIEKSEGDFCILLSAHCYPVDDLYIQRLVAPLIKNTSIAASYGGQLPIYGVDPFEEIELKLWFPTKNVGSGVPVSNSNACIRKQIWSNLKFNEKLNSGEDDEWAKRVKTCGHSIVYVPEAAVYHSHQISVKSIYKRWYFRGRTETLFLLSTKKINFLIKFKVILPVTLLFTFFMFLKFSFLSLLNCLNKNYFDSLWKLPFYEFFRMYAFFKGIIGVVAESEKGIVCKNFCYFELRLPFFLKKFQFLEK